MFYKNRIESNKNTEEYDCYGRVVHTQVISEPTIEVGSH
jgi:hypothetical protein